MLLKVSCMKGVMWFDRRVKFRLRYIRPFEILKRMGKVAYELVLPPGLARVHPIFHISMLRKFYGGGNYVVH